MNGGIFRIRPFLGFRGRVGSGCTSGCMRKKSFNTATNDYLLFRIRCTGKGLLHP